MNKRFFIRTFGCQMNKNDSSIISHILEHDGFKAVDDLKNADIVIVNTCSVRAHAETRALGYIATLKNWRKKSKRVLGVVGCMAERLADTITKDFPHVDLILGPDSYRKISGYVNELYSRDTRIIETTLHGETYCGIHPQKNTVSSFVSIMRGCNNFCSYCVVPYVRGRARSRSAKDIVEEIAYLVASGVKDITLLGQNVNEYSYKGTGFADLLKMCAGVRNMSRLRFLTSHPKDIDDALIQVVREHDNICEWFHLPLQSGCNRILKLMNRQYTKEDYLSLIDRIRKAIPTATITTDVIAGFPTETEEEFLETLSTLEKIEFHDAYMYCYSSREGTKAYDYPSLSESVIKRRLKKLIDFQGRIILNKTKEMIGKRFEILFEGKAKNNATRGKTRGNKDVIVEQNIIAGTVDDVIIQSVRGRTPIGVLIGNIEKPPIIS